LIAYQTATTTFQGTWAQPQQAMASALRAAETGRPVVHAALTGVSTAYDATGHRQLWLTSGQRSATVLTLRLTGGRTPFDIAGDWVLALSAAILAVALLRAVGGARPYFQRDPS
jgi:apolipoprotein N-acyltransferase